MLMPCFCHVEYGTYIISSSQQRDEISTPRLVHVDVPDRLTDMQHSYGLFSVCCSRRFVPKMSGLYLASGYGGGGWLRGQGGAHNGKL